MTNPAELLDHAINIVSVYYDSHMPVAALDDREEFERAETVEAVLTYLRSLRKNVATNTALPRTLTMGIQYLQDLTDSEDTYTSDGRRIVRYWEHYFEGDSTYFDNRYYAVCLLEDGTLSIYKSLADRSRSLADNVPSLEMAMRLIRQDVDPFPFDPTGDC